MAIRSNIADARLDRVDYRGQPRGPAGGPVMAVNADLAAAGSSNTDAAAITAGGYTEVTGADATKGVILPDIEIGSTCWIKNADAANAVLKIYPSAGAAINALTATTGGYSMAAKVTLVFVRKTLTKWVTFPLLGS